MPLRGKRPKSFAAFVLAVSTNVCRSIRPRFDAVGVVEIDAIFERRNAVGDLGEIVAAHGFLRREIERRVIGRERGDEALAQAVPKHVLVAACRAAAAT